MPQIELRPFMARTMVEDGERVKPFAARRRVAGMSRLRANRSRRCGKICDRVARSGS
jgi:hypothetical protein